LAMFARDRGYGLAFQGIYLSRNAGERLGVRAEKRFSCSGAENPPLLETDYVCPRTNATIARISSAGSTGFETCS
jgi:hypothetical protein